MIILTPIKYFYDGCQKVILICPFFYMNWILTIRKNLEHGSSTPVSQMLGLQACATMPVSLCLFLYPHKLIKLNTLFVWCWGLYHWAELPAPSMYFEAQIVSDLASVSSHVHGTYALPSLSTRCAGHLTLSPQPWTGQEALVPLNKKDSI